MQAAIAGGIRGTITDILARVPQRLSIRYAG